MYRMQDEKLIPSTKPSLISKKKYSNLAHKPKSKKVRQSPATYPELTFRLEVGACKSPIDQRAWRYAKQTLYAGSRPTAECFLSSALWKSKQQTSRRTVRNGFGQNAGV